MFEKLISEQGLTIFDFRSKFNVACLMAKGYPTLIAKFNNCNSDSEVVEPVVGQTLNRKSLYNQTKFLIARCPFNGLSFAIEGATFDAFGIGQTSLLFL